MPISIDEPEETEIPTLPKPQVHRSWWQRVFPWVASRTRIAAPTDDDALLVDNRTSDAWSLHLGYRDLGTIEPRGKLEVRVVKSGMLTVRQIDAPVGVGYLVAHLGPITSRVEIRSERVGGEMLYDLRLFEGRRSVA